MVEKLDFKKEVLDSLACKPTRFEVEDSKTPGLRLTVFPSGVKTYQLFKKVKGVSQRIKIARLSDISIGQARTKAIQLKAEITLGANPHEAKKESRKHLTFREIYHRYDYEHARRHTKGADHNRKMMELHFFPKFGNRKLYDISRSDVQKLHVKLGEDSGIYAANRVIALVSATYNFATKTEYYTGFNPCSKLTRFKANKRDRFLNKAELNLFFDAINQEPELYRHYFSLLLYTGARKTNLMSVRWSEIDFDLARWRISEKNAKNAEVNIVNLSPLALEILKLRNDTNQALDCPSLFVFPGTGKKGHLRDPKKSFDRIRKRMDVYDIRIHDLRRTLGSYMAINGASLPIIGAALNHKDYRSTQIYARLSNDPIVEAINSASELFKNSPIAKFKDNCRAIKPEKNLPLTFSQITC